MSYTDFKASVMPNGQGQVIGDGECVSLVVNNSRAYSEYLFPGVSWTSIFPPVPAARQLLADASPVYFQRIDNDHNDPNQVPLQGDVMVFDATPQAGYTNTFDNPFGHTGVCESADANGYTLLQQNSPYSGAPANATHYPWNYRPCLGWLRPVIHVPAPVVDVVPTPAPVATPEPPTPVVEPVPTPAPETVIEPTVVPSSPVTTTTSTSPQSSPLPSTMKSPSGLGVFPRALLNILKGILRWFLS